MTTRREQILQNIVSSLAGTAGVGSRIYRSRVEPFARNESPSILVEPATDTSSVSVVPKTDWVLSVNVVVVVRGETPDQIADPVIESLHAKLMADPSRGGLAMDTYPVDVQWDFAEGDSPIGIARCMYRVQYRTASGDLSMA